MGLHPLSGHRYDATGEVQGTRGPGGDQVRVPPVSQGVVAGPKHPGMWYKVALDMNRITVYDYAVAACLGLALAGAAKVLSDE